MIKQIDKAKKIRKMENGRNKLYKYYFCLSFLFEMGDLVSYCISCKILESNCTEFQFKFCLLIFHQNLVFGGEISELKLWHKKGYWNVEYFANQIFIASLFANH